MGLFKKTNLFSKFTFLLLADSEEEKEEQLKAKEKATDKNIYKFNTMG